MSTRRQEGMRRKSVFSRPVVLPYLLEFFFLLHLVDGHQSAHLKPHGVPDGYAFPHEGLAFDLQEDYMILELRELMEADPDSAGLHKHAPEEAVPDQSRALHRFLQASTPATNPPSYPAYLATYPSPEPLFPGTLPTPSPAPPPRPPTPDFTNCKTPYVIDLPGTTSGNSLHLETVDTCRSRNSHDGIYWDLNGRDYTFYLPPTDGVRLMTVETKETASGRSFDTVLYAFETCDEYHSWNSLRTRDDDNGDGSLSKLEWTMEPGKGMYIVLVGWGYICGRTDVVFTALIPPPPLPPSPPPPPNPPPVPPYCYADRFQSPTGGYQDYCSINNDPHIYPFRRGPGGAYVYSHLICNIDGNFLITENDFFIIHGRGKSKPEWRNRGASVVQSVNITYKDPTCGGTIILAGQGVCVFEYCSSYYGCRTYTRENCERWQDPLINSEVTTYSYAMSSGERYLSIYVKTPWTGYDGVCTPFVGCPIGTQVEPPWFWSFFGKRRALLQGSNGTEQFQNGTDAFPVEDVNMAMEQCQAQNVTGSYLESCVFDVVATNDTKAFLNSNKDSKEQEETIAQEVEDENNQVAAIVGPPPPLPSPPPSPSPGPSASPFPSPLPSQTASPPTTSEDNVCTLANETAATFYIEMDLDFDEVQGTGFKESLLSALRNSIAQEFSGYLSNGVMECSNFVEAVLSPGSVVAEVNINLGSDASPSDASSLEEDLDSLSTESVEERLLAGMGENRPRVLAAGTSKSDLEPDSDSDGSGNNAEVLGPAISIPVFFFLVALTLVGYYVYHQSKYRQVRSDPGMV